MLHGDSSRCSEEIVENLKVCLSMSLLSILDSDSISGKVKGTPGGEFTCSFSTDSGSTS